MKLFFFLIESQVFSERNHLKKSNSSEFIFLVSIDLVEGNFLFPRDHQVAYFKPFRSIFIFLNFLGKPLFFTFDKNQVKFFGFNFFLSFKKIKIYKS